MKPNTFWLLQLVLSGYVGLISSRTQLNREQRGTTVETAPKTNRVVKALVDRQVRAAEAWAGLEVVQAVAAEVAVAEAMEINNHK
jgi:hypothetical protein